MNSLTFLLNLLLKCVPDLKNVINSQSFFLLFSTVSQVLFFLVNISDSTSIALTAVLSLHYYKNIY